jgi:VIT1/CCC1 family predicted Fe2+/Mn2+ transporter
MLTGASFRGWAVDANDGIIATAGILEGFAGAGATDSVLVTAATAATISGALGLGGATWAEQAAEREIQLALAEDERAELAADPRDQVRELAERYEARGLPAALAQDVAERLTAHDPVGAQLVAQHGIDGVMPRAAPVWAGVSACLAYAAGAAVPLLITVSVSVDVEAWAIFAAVTVSLALTSLLATRLGHLSVSRTLVRTLAVGLGTMAVSYLVGRALF